MSTSVNRPGCSACAPRSRPRTAACAGSASSPGRAATAPRVVTTTGPAPSSNSCARCRTCSATWCAALAGSTPTGVSGAASTVAPSGAAAAAASVTGRQAIRNRPSAPVGACPAVTVRSVSAATLSTGAPSASTAHSRTGPSPERSRQTRSIVAPVACSRTPRSVNGSSRRAEPTSSGCSAASSSAGCRWKPPVATSSGSSTSAQIRSPRRHMARSPRNVSPYA